MNKYLPFVFPLAALVIVLFLAFRWFSMRNEQPAPTIGEGVEIEDLTPEEESVLQGTGDFQQVTLENQATESAEPAQGALRYEIGDERVRFSVLANLPAPAEGFYQAWIKTGNSEQKAFRLEPNKGGYMGTAAISQDAIPFEVIVSLETQDDNTLEQEMLRGVVTE